MDEKIDESLLEELVTMDEKINKVEESLEHYSSDEKLLELYEARKNARIEYNSAISYAERKGEERVIQVTKLILQGKSDIEIFNDTGIDISKINEIRKSLK